ncbi:MAG TPA: HAD family hydrolase [Oceanithermus profundus]|uniref:HAD family hydrolase n=1 Tax=Oceanithermus profundus TaxID=187137 RepID=A0A7C5SPG2_9DEIN|nr:HAD family hydrolase [Oceanithermus profundus]
MIRAVVFDRDGVLMRPARGVVRRFAEWLAPCTPGGLGADVLLATLTPIWERYAAEIRRLKVPPEEEARFWLEMARELLRRLKSRCSPAELVATWPYYRFIEPTVGARPLLEWLQVQGYTVAVLSNTTPSLRESLAYHGLAEFVDRFFASNTLGLLKPDGRIFRRVGEELGLPPEAIAYFDDYPDNVRVARTLGWHAYLVRLGEPGPEVVHDLDLIYEILER